MTNQNNSGVCLKPDSNDPIYWFTGYYSNYGLQAATDISPFVAPAWLNHKGNQLADQKLLQYRQQQMADTYVKNTHRKEGVYNAKAIRKDILVNKVPAMEQILKKEVLSNTADSMKKLGNGFAAAGAGYEIGKSIASDSTTKDFVAANIKALGILGTTAAIAALPASVPFAAAATLSVAAGMLTSFLLDKALNSKEFDDLLGDIGKQKLSDTWEYLNEDFFNDLNQQFNDIAEKFLNDNFDAFSKKAHDAIDNFPLNSQCHKFDPQDWESVNR
ncbi:hypothetical protein, partial [Neisseria wadsworthii]